MNDSSIIQFNKPLSPNPTIAERNLTYDFFTISPEGVKNVTYRNGTIALFQVNETTGNDTFVRYIRAPSSFFVNYNDVMSPDGILKRTFENGTIRYIYPTMTSANSRKDNATATDFFDFYPNGTSRRYYKNGTIAVFFQGSLL